LEFEISAGLPAVVCDLELGICDLFGIYDLEFEISAGLPAVSWDFLAHG